MRFRHNVSEDNKRITLNFGVSNWRRKC